MPMMRRRMPAAFLLSLAAACATPAQQEARARQEIQAHLEAYLPRLAESYASGEPAGLGGLAAAKEIAGVEKRISDLAFEGRRLQPAFRGLVLESVEVWNYSNAYATTLETWDLRIYATGSERLLSERIGEKSRVKYQLKRDEGRWLVLFRAVEG